jgi:hypothetical protein
MQYLVEALAHLEFKLGDAVALLRRFKLHDLADDWQSAQYALEIKLCWYFDYAASTGTGWFVTPKTEFGD